MKIIPRDRARKEWKKYSNKDGSYLYMFMNK